jgi:hypothetical protein
MNSGDQIYLNRDTILSLAFHMAGLHYRVAVLEGLDPKKARDQAFLLGAKLLSELKGYKELTELSEDELQAVQDGITAAISITD